MRDAPEVVIGDDGVLRERLRAILRAAAAAAAEREGRRWSMAVPGGSVVRRLLAGLGAGDAPWGEGDLFWCDERDVPPLHPDSNYGASAAGWLGALSGSGLRLHPMPGGRWPLDEGARRYEQDLVAALGAEPVLDLVVLGVGEDGHVASLFPGHRALEERHRLVVAVEDSPKPPPRRLTLTLPVLVRARVVVVAAFGAGKREAMAAALRHDASDLPVARLLREASRGVVLMDEEAVGGG